MQLQDQQCGNLVQTRLEAVASMSKRQNDELYGVIYGLKETLSRLRGEHPSKEEGEKSPLPFGLLPEIEFSFQKRDEAITLLSEIEKELRSLI